MSEFLPRTGPVPIVKSATERGPAVRPPVPAKAGSSATEAEKQPAAILTQRFSGAADYARIKARIAEVVSRIEPPTAPLTHPVEAAERAIVALMPAPAVTLPLPPADPQMVAFVAQVAQSMAAQAAQARAAQANATPLLVEAAAN
jgi:hypothetical protein